MLLIAVQIHVPAHRGTDDIGGLPAAVRPRLTEIRDADHDKGRVHYAQCGVIEPEGGHFAGHRRFDQHVGLRDELAKEVASRFEPQFTGDRSLARIHRPPVDAHLWGWISAKEGAIVSRRVAFARLDFDHLGPQFAEQAGTELPLLIGEIEYAVAREWAGVNRRGWSLGGRVLSNGHCSCSTGNLGAIQTRGPVDRRQGTPTAPARRPAHPRFGPAPCQVPSAFRPKPGRRCAAAPRRRE